MGTLRLIHLSDIHFGGYGSGWDENQDQRNELLMDIGTLVDEGGPVDGVLVGGDIAYHARSDQYGDATTWLERVCAAGKCLPGRVWVVPGNHDLSRPIHGATKSRRFLLEEIRSAADASVSKVLSDWFLVDPTAEGLLHCLHEYNEFAGQWGCETTAKSPNWKDETLALDGLNVYLSGLNSVLASDTVDWEDGPTLVLGKYQCELPRAMDRVHVAFVHHPPAWLRDWPQVEGLLKKRAHLLLFGHEHVYKAQQTVPGGTVEVFAGAVGPHAEGDPAADHPDFVPSWNMITLERDHDELVVTVQPRVWSETAFAEHPDEKSTFRVNLDLNIPVPPPGPERAMPEPEDASPLAPHQEGDQVPLPPANVRSDLRELSVRFMKLTPPQREEIADRLGVADGLGELNLGARERPREILRRVAAAGKTDDLLEAMNG